MPRQKNDGRGRIGGREKGTPNKNNIIKNILKAHSEDYFSPDKEEIGEDGKPTGRIVSQFDLDLRNLKSVDRVNAELSVLKYHTPQMQAAAIDMSVDAQDRSFSTRLARLSNGESIAPDNEE